MKINSKNEITEITENELYTLYVKRGYCDVMTFQEYKDLFKEAGTKILEESK